VRKFLSMTAIAAAVVAAPMQAQEMVTVPRSPNTIAITASYAEDADFGVGLRYENDLNKLISSMSPNVHFIIGADYFFPGDPVDSYAELNLNLSYQFGDMRRAIGPYFGGGLNLARLEAGPISDTEVGLNILGGLRFRSASRMVPFVEVRYEIGGGEQFVISGGLFLF